MVAPLRVGSLLKLTLAISVLGLGPGYAETSEDEAPATRPGMVFNQTPQHLPGGLPAASSIPTGDVDRAIQLFRAGDLDRARAEIEPFLAVKRPHDSEYLRANFLLGYLYMQDEDWQLASLHFYRVRSSEHPLAIYAAYYEAYVDYRRGKYRASVPECEGYRERFPEGPFYEDCQLLIADSHREWGHAGTAAKLYKAYQDEHEDDGHIKESIQIAIARAYEVGGNANSAARMYANIAVSHQYATNGVAAEEGLARMAEAGHTIPEFTDHELWVRANALKNSYRWAEAYGLFKELFERYEDQPDSAFYKKLEANEYSFRWQTRQYGAIAAESTRKFEETRGKPGASEYLHRAISAYNKGGDFTNAAKYAEIARTEYRSSGRFGGIEKDLAWYYTNGTDYENANGAWKRCYKGSRKGFYKWMVAYTTYRAGKYEEGIDALTALVDSNGTYSQSARFYRAKCNIALNRLGAARADFDQILKDEPEGWYSQVIKSRRRRARHVEFYPGVARDGTWPAPDSQVDALIPDVPAQQLAVQEILDNLAKGPFPEGRERSLPRTTAMFSVDGRPLAPPVTDAAEPAVDVEPDADGVISHRPQPRWNEMTWPYPQGVSPVIQPLPASPIAHSTVPRGRAGVAYDRDKALATFGRFVDSYEEVWPMLPVTYELVRLGFDEEARALMHDIYEEIKSTQKSRRISRKIKEYDKELVAQEQSEKQAQEEPDNPDAGPSAEKIEPVKAAMLPPLREEERWKRMMSIRASGTAWRDLFILTGAPHEMSIFAPNRHKLSNLGRGDSDALAAWRQAYPLAYGEQVWRLCQQLDMDPMVIFSLMRQESTYHPTVVSHAGAIGVMQIMPGTGSKVASLARYGPYSVENLREPEVNVFFGIWYLSRLLARYDGQFPLAIGSYNGGPHNIGRWLRSKHGIGLEEFVEEIPFDETRGYVKKVVRNYAIYLAIYDPDAYVQLPRTTRPDNPEIIDF